MCTYQKEDGCAHIKRRMDVHISKRGWVCIYQKENGCAHIKRRMGVHISKGGWVCTYQKEDGCPDGSSGYVFSSDQLHFTYFMCLILLKHMITSNTLTKK